MSRRRSRRGKALAPLVADAYEQYVYATIGADYWFPLAMPIVQAMRGCADAIHARLR